MGRGFGLLSCLGTVNFWVWIRTVELLKDCAYFAVELYF